MQARCGESGGPHHRGGTIIGLVSTFHIRKIVNINLQKDARCDNMASQADEALKALDELQADYSLSIIKLSDSITFPDGAAETGTTRSSDASAANDEDQDTNPATLRADLAHYKVWPYPNPRVVV